MNITNPIASTNPSKFINTDSPINCTIKLFLLAPIAFRIPTSPARLMEFAVDKLM